MMRMRTMWLATKNTKTTPMSSSCVGFNKKEKKQRQKNKMVNQGGYGKTPRLY